MQSYIILPPDYKYFKSIFDMFKNISNYFAKKKIFLFYHVIDTRAHAREAKMAKMSQI